VISEFLLKQYKSGCLAQVYLVSGYDLKTSLSELEKFAKVVLGTDNLKNSGEYIYIAKDSKSKNITIDQIRFVQEFSYKTSVISGNKIIVIYGADQMNINAANSCLKLLEDTPSNSYIFLLTAHPYNLLPTILSRCTKINLPNQSDNIDLTTHSDLLDILMKDCPFAKKQQFIEKFSLKDRDLWQEFASYAENLLAKLSRYKMGIINSIEDRESRILLQLKSDSLPYLENKYTKLSILINNVNEYDLDLRASAIMLIDLFAE